MSDIVKDFPTKKLNTSVKGCWRKRANVFKFTTENQNIQKELWNKTQMHFSSLKSKKTAEKKVSEDIWNYKIKGINKDFNSQISKVVEIRISM